MRVVHYVPFIDRTKGGVSAFIDILSRDLGDACDLYVITHMSDNGLTCKVPCENS